VGGVIARRLRLSILLPLVGLAVVLGTAAADHGARPRAVAAPPRPSPPPAPVTEPEAVADEPVALLITVLDGDRRARVPGARVRVAGTSAVTDRAGLARISVRRLRRLAVTVTKSGFSSRTVLEEFDHGRQVTIRIYRPELQWPIYGVTPTRTQAQSHIRLQPPFRVIWSVSIGALIEFPAVVDDGVAYIGNAHASIRAVSMRSGRAVWRHDTPNGEMASSPAVAGDALVYHSMDGHVFVLDRATGHERWSYEAGSPIESSPIVHDGVDYFGAWNGRVFALDLRTHTLRWSRDLGAKITSSASISGDTLYIGDYGGRLWALSTRTGATRWTASVNGRVYGTPAVEGGRIFVPSSTGNSLTALSTGGRELWRVVTGGYVYSSPAVWHGVVCFGSYDGYLYGVSAASGRVLWRAPAGGAVSGAAVVVDGIAYAGSFAHRIIGVRVATGKTVFTFRHGYYVPVSGNGMRLLLHGYSRLYAVEPRSTSKQDRAP
jgi:outer membrane protein assembly factor BamB